ncbi:hypothetical protein L2E82_17201 [Cichorium intybus]|uniref:Uncharacterized protein n=1 Tax=Cichorium intybus TaxID=13427 RepID=A0ACB9F7L9_CICIN|nr:hypothetical protein L2E82_17201 [Cichorium intybus]
MLKREYLNALFLSSSHLLYDFFFLFSPNICLHIDPLFESQFFWNSAAASSKLALKQPTIRVVTIIAEGVPESDTKELISYARSNNKVITGPATVGGIQAGAFKIGDTAGTIDNIIQCK